MIIPKVHIEQIRPELTWKLRHHVLYPNTGNIYTQGIPTDSEGTHFGAFYGNNLAGIVSLFQKATDFQFRKLAVEVTLQRKGIGKQLIRYVTGYVISQGGTRLWCNARTTAIGFYEKQGFTTAGETFYRNGIEYIVIEKWLLQNLPADEGN